MPDIYKKCFIGLRLTQYDGNANTVQEFESMNIPIIHNLSLYGEKWTDFRDITDTIIKYFTELYEKDKFYEQEQLEPIYFKLNRHKKNKRHKIFNLNEFEKEQLENQTIKIRISKKNTRIV